MTPSSTRLASSSSPLQWAILLALCLVLAACGGGGGGGSGAIPGATGTPARDVSSTSPATIPPASTCTLGAEPIRVFDATESGTFFLNVESLAPYAPHQFFAANFEDLLTIDFATGQIARVPVEGPAGRQTQPTGLYFARNARLLFVAEYLLNKVSVYSVAGDTLRFLFEFDGMVSPEGLVFDEASSMLFVAEFDGHSATAWHIDASARSATLAWRQEVKFAHGITLARGQLYVAELLFPSIHVFDPATGRPLQVFGERGWDPWRLQFQWPTSLDVDASGNLIVSDAETGYVSVIDLTRLATKAVLGGAGPGRSRFSEPYLAILDFARDKLAVGSTKDERFVFLEYPTLCPIMSMYRNSDRWTDFPLDVPVFRPEGDDYSWLSGPTVSALGRDFFIYSSALVDRASGHVLDPALGKQLQFLGDASTGYLFSPYTTAGPLLLRQVGSVTYAMYFPSSMGRDGVAINCWPFSGAIRCSDRSGYNTSRMERLADEFVERTEARRCANGLVPLPVLEAEVNRLRGAAAAESNTRPTPVDWTEVFASETGQDFLSAYSSLDACAADAQQVEAVRALAHEEDIRESLFDLSYRSVLVGSY